MASPADQLAQIFANAINQGMGNSTGELSQAAKDAAKAAADEIIAEAGPGEGGILGFFSGLPIIGSVLHDIEGLLPHVGKLTEGLILGWALGSTFAEIIRPGAQTLINTAWSAHPSLPIDAQTAADLVARGLLSPADGAGQAANTGIAQPQFDELVAGATQRPDVGTALQLLNRKALSESFIAGELHHLGYTPETVGALLTLRRQLLSPADLALAQLRGEMDAATAQGYADQLGVTADDMAVLVANTGEPPGPEQLMEALRRGFIDKGRFDRGIRQSRVRDEWIDVEFALRQAPMTIADSIRAVVENHLTQEEGQKIADENGLIPEHFPILVESWGRPLSHEQMLTLYHRGQATLEQVKQAIRESDVKNKYIDQAIELGRRLVPERTIVSMLDHSVIDRATAETMLKEQGFSEDDAKSLIALGVAQRTHAAKNLTKADIIGMYEDALLRRQDAIDHLVKLGFPADVSGQLLDYADAKKAANALRTTERGIEASLKAHHLTQEQAIADLTKAGVEPARAQALVDEWTHERGTATRTLTEAQILRLGEKKILSPDDTRTRLIAYGLIGPDADLLLQLHGIGQPPAIAPPVA